MTRIIRLSAAIVLGVPLAAAPQTSAPTDTPAVAGHLAKARQAAGSEWTPTFDFVCKVNPDRANRVDDPQIEPTRIFDNLFAIGRTSTVVYAVTTSAGIVLIDSGYADQIETVLLPGLRKAGLDPANVRYVLLGHGHGDHFGGAAYFQQRGARVVSSAPDWDLMAKAPPMPQPPTRDVVAAEGQPIVVGDVSFTPVAIPGHTPGSLGYIFSVRDRARMHTAGLFGGSILIPTKIPNEGLQQYIRSIEHFGDVSRKMGVDVEIQNHPLYDGFEQKLRRLRARRPADPHPFVVGRDAYQRFLTVMAECTRAQMERRRSL
jgi:metallo-beta-lactamase class B